MKNKHGRRRGKRKRPVQGVSHNQELQRLFKRRRYSTLPEDQQTPLLPPESGDPPEELEEALTQFLNQPKKSDNSGQKNRRVVKIKRPSNSVSSNDSCTITPLSIQIQSRRIVNIKRSSNSVSSNDSSTSTPLNSRIRSRLGPPVTPTNSPANPTPVRVALKEKSSINANLSWQGSKRKKQDLMVAVTDKLNGRVKCIYESSSSSPARHEPLELTPGKVYTANAYAVETKDTPNTKEKRVVVSKDAVEFRAEYNGSELENLYDKALKHLRETHTKTHPILYFYRNKPDKYYDFINHNQGNIMHPHMKDLNGSAASSINGKLKGLFFSGHIDLSTGKPPNWSPFGNCRFHVKADRILTWTTNVYFADFYCFNVVHYVVLVLTKEGSEADVFCKKHLMELPALQNPFLFRSQHNNVIRAAMNKEFLVEVFYTESVNIGEEMEESGFMQHVPAPQHVRPGIIARNECCDVCKLYV